MERQVLAEMMIDVSKLKLIEVKPEWFEDKQLSYIVEDLVEHQDDEVDLLMMAERIKIKYPSTVIDQNLLFDLASEVASNARLEKHVKQLKINYYQRRLSNASVVYAKNPEPSNYRKMKDAMVLLDEIQNNEDEKDSDIKNVVENFLEKMENGTSSGLKTYESVDAVMGDGMQPGTFFIVAARPAVGKTTMAINLATKALERNPGVLIDMFTLEAVQEETLKKFISRLSGINSYKFVNTKLQLNQKEKNRVVAEAAFLEDTNIGLIDRCHTIDSIIRTIRRRQYTAKGMYVAFIDYLQLINGDSNKSRQQQIGEVTRKLKLLANELGIVIIALSQVNRDVDKRTPPRPTLSDLRESGDIEQDANAVAFMWAEEENDGTVNFEIAKNRYGKTATIPFKFFKSISLLEESLV